ncbi:MAG: DNA-directed DNA polymerase [Nanoarchaeota archaeon]
MTVTKFFPLDIEYNNGIRIYGKTIDNKTIYVIDSSFKPFFYVTLKNDREIEKIKSKIESIKVEKSFVLLTKIVKKNYLGREKQAIKVVVNSQKALNEIKGIINSLPEVEKILEADINIIKKYLTDSKIIPLTLCEVEGEIKTPELNVDVQMEGTVKMISEGVIAPKIIAFDLETYSNDYENDPIITMALCSSDGYKKIITWKKIKDKDIECISNELELIKKFLEIIKEQKPDMLVGYFSDGFDLPYLIARAKKNNIRLNINIDRTEPKLIKKNNQAVKVKGPIHIDILQFIKRVMSGPLQLDSYSLNTVSQELLGEKKKDIEIRKIKEIWDSGNIKELCEYNLQDAELTLKLCKKFLPNLIELVKLIGNPLFDISRMSYGQLVENYLIKKADEFNELVPNKPTYEEISIRKMYTYQGAFVMEPVPGLYNNIIIFDFMSLYPTIVIAKNICPSTINNTEGYKSPIIEGWGKNNVYYFSNKKDGFIPSVIKDLILRRNRIKEILKEEENPILEARSHALKTVANSTYGYLGFFGARWYSKECAASITAFAREYIKDVIEKTKKAGFDVIYSDTDSVAFTLGEKTEEEALSFLKKINEELPSLMELELDGFYPYGLFVPKKTESRGAKKKYALIDHKGNIIISGFETVRGDWSPIARETQKKVIEILLKENSPQKALKHIAEIIEKVNKKEIPVSSLIIKEQLIKRLESYEQIGPHVAVAKRMKERGIKITPGMPIWFVIVEGKGMIRDRARLPDECKEGEYDADYYINNQIIPSIEKILEIFNYKKEDLLKKDQSSLGTFLK